MITGMILAAGFGTRLQPYTDKLPKALVPFCGKPMIAHVIDKMKDFGIERIVVNVHHKRELLIEYLTKNNFGVEIIISDEKEEHLLTGGGIKNAIKYFGKRDFILIHNTDIISSIDYNELINFHREKNAGITLAIRKKNDSRVLLFDDNKQLIGWENKVERITRFRQKTTSFEEFGFTGIYVISKHLFEYFPKEKKFDIIDFLLTPNNEFQILGYVDNSPYWFDLGSVEKINEAEKYFGCN
jgi:MurNAc alpha-1-phosphate uridylyltransferase